MLCSASSLNEQVIVLRDTGLLSGVGSGRGVKEGFCERIMLSTLFHSPCGENIDAMGMFKCFFMLMHNRSDCVHAYSKLKIRPLCNQHLQTTDLK